MSAPDCPAVHFRQRSFDVERVSLDKPLVRQFLQLNTSQFLVTSQSVERSDDLSYVLFELPGVAPGPL